MNGDDDSPEMVIARLRSLRELSWDRPDHRRRLEERIMDEGRGSTRRLKWLSAKAALFVGLVLLGGMAAGATTMWIVSEITVEPGTPDGEGNCTWIITHPDGTVEETEPLPEDSQWFVIEGDEENDGALLGLTPCDPPDGAAASPDAAAPADGTGSGDR